MRFSSITPLDGHFTRVYQALCRNFCRSVIKSQTCSITFDGLRAECGFLVIGVTWHFINSDSVLKCIPTVTLNVEDTSKDTVHLGAILSDIVNISPIVGSDRICIHKESSDNERVTANAMDLFTNYVDSTRGVVHSLGIVAIGVFTPITELQRR